MDDSKMTDETYYVRWRWVDSEGEPKSSETNRTELYKFLAQLWFDTTEQWGQRGSPWAPDPSVGQIWQENEEFENPNKYIIVDFVDGYYKLMPLDREGFKKTSQDASTLKSNFDYMNNKLDPRAESVVRFGGWFTSEHVQILVFECEGCEISLDELAEYEKRGKETEKQIKLDFNKGIKMGKETDRLFASAEFPSPWLVNLYRYSKMEQSTCAICLEPLGGYAPFIIKLSCEHMFHRKCIQKVSNFSSETTFKCPTCRAVIPESELEGDGEVFLAVKTNKEGDIVYKLREELKF